MPGRILIVDDDPEMRELFSDILNLDAHEVRTASNLEEVSALEWPEGPQVIFADAGLAAGDDIPALGSALAGRWPESEVIYLADASNPRAKRRLERGRLRHFARPFQIEELRDLVGELLQRQALTGR